MGRGQHPDPGSGIGNEQPGSFFLELRNHFFWVKHLNSLMRIRDTQSVIRDGDSSDPGWKKSRIRDPGSGINIPDPQHCYLGMFMVEADSILFCG
jgi:hypothetical protein